MSLYSVVKLKSGAINVPVAIIPIQWLLVQNNHIHSDKLLLFSWNSLTTCLLSIQSLRNKTADFVDYVCKTKVDLFAIR